MIARLLCLVGLHSWAIHKTELAYLDGQHEVYRVFSYCRRCRKTREWYDDGE